MRTPLLLWLVASGSLACSAADSVRAEETPIAWIDPADPAIAAVRQTGERMIERVGQLLVYESQRVVAEKGPALAVEAVHIKNLELPKVPPGRPQVTAVKLTSVQLRNPANQADPADQASLDLVETALQDGDDVPSVLIQRVNRPGAAPEWRVARPITTMLVCIQCHGPLEKLSPEIRSALAAKFPEDQAVVYAERKWRGLIRVSITAPELTVTANAK